MRPAASITGASGDVTPGDAGVAALIDAAGVAHRPARGGARIVSLVPSLTELLFDLDLGDNVVGRTAFCVHPADRVKRVRSVGGTKTVNMVKLRAAAPTHVLVNIDETPRALAQALADEGYEIVVTHPIEVADNLALYRLIGGLFDRAAAAAVLCERFSAALSALQSAVAALPERRVLYLIWCEPWMSVAPQTYISRMLALGGLRTVPDPALDRYPQVDLNDALLRQVERVLFSTEPFPFEQRHIDAFAARFPEHAGKARLIDAEMVSWYGSRAIAGLAYLADFVRSV